MEYFASSESYRPAGLLLERVRRSVTPFLKVAIAGSSLAALQCTLRYIPIVMPRNLHARYPPRSKLRRKENLYDCAPILDYDIFVGGSFEDALREYLRGLSLSAPHLPALGASPLQVEEFNIILADAADRILVEQSDQTRR